MAYRGSSFSYKFRFIPRMKFANISRVTHVARYF